MKRIRVLAATALMGISVAAVADEGYQAPLGLQWGESKETAVSKYNASPADRGDARMKLFALGNPPIRVPGFNDYYGLFDDKYGLVKILVAETITEDAYGTTGIEEYKKLKDILAKKYGKPTGQYEYIGKKVYKNSDEFYECLAYQGCGAYTAFYKPAGGGTIGLEMHGKSRGEGFITVSYESTLFNKATKEEERDAHTQSEQGL